MASESETVGDLVKELRGIKGGQHTNGGLSFERWRARCQFADDYANRFEAAHQREVAELKSKMNDVVCENEALRAACGTCGAKRERETTREKSSLVGNAAKMREALERIASMGEQIEHQLGSSEETVYAFRHERSLANGISECARAALSVPTRNCDRPECATTKAAQDVWRKEDGGKTAYYEWLLAAYTEGV